MTWGEALALALAIALVIAVFLGRRKARSNFASARAESFAQGKASVELSNRIDVHVGDNQLSVLGMPSVASAAWDDPIPASLAPPAVVPALGTATRTDDDIATVLDLDHVDGPTLVARRHVRDVVRSRHVSNSAVDTRSNRDGVSRPVDRS